MSRLLLAVICVSVVWLPDVAIADEPTQPLQWGGYVEAQYQWNWNRPFNGITAWRGFDNRHNSLTLANVALDARWQRGDLSGRITAQAGHTPASYYQAEPSQAAAAGAGGSNANLWQHLQQAWMAYRFGIGRGLTLTAGLVLSPIGPETLAVRDNWNWSRSNLFFGLPFYHTGVQLAYPLTNTTVWTIAAWNGWNSVVDANDGKSISSQLVWTRPTTTLSVLYFGGVERPRGASEGQPWRHLLDAHLTWQTTASLALLAHGDAGFEQNRFGTSYWAAGALYARLQVLEPLWLSCRGDVFVEHVAQSAAGTASVLFWPAPWVASATTTLDYRPRPEVSLRLEFRHDQAGGTIYAGPGPASPATAAAAPFGRATQDTLALGMAAGF